METTTSDAFSLAAQIGGATSLCLMKANWLSVPAEYFDAELDVAKARMADLITAEPELQDFSHREFVAYARAADLVQQVVAENKADLVVAGSHGARGMELLALGSVAESILREVACPVLIVGPHCRAEAHPFRAILFATDLEATGLRSAQFASALAECFHSSLTMLQGLKSSLNVFAIEFSLDTGLATMREFGERDPDVSRTLQVRGPNGFITFLEW